ncbi:MAG TPA: carbohydrate-binding family 9-like protein, partial [Thermoanaerobaculia bacterium]|nr:carbohydrate-binding family 9-like protein [Thermoanaerobaculia bacterium]
MPPLPAGAEPRGPLARLPWPEIAPLPSLVLADSGGAPTQPTRVRLAWHETALHVRFDCADRDAWSTFTRRDDPLYREEVVEVFLAPGAADPALYYEIEVSPQGVLFDARVENPHSRRDTLRADTAWDCPGLRWGVGAAGPAEDWWAALAIPWAAIVPDGVPALWRANFYRIERPRDGSAPEFSAWSPTLASPPDFHRPSRFGRLSLASL